ncbi:MAG TPA: hypothetical protein VFC65_13770 [Prolixibacteraceae bacterium]|nr:hypothetical protein [Prolixibacteraceae bacterium]
MILTDYIKGEKLKENKAQYRFEITQSTMEYDKFQLLLINKRNPNPRGWSFNFVPRPKKWNGAESPDMAITKGSENISSVYIPNPSSPYGYGDIKGTNDACLVIFNKDYKMAGIISIELLIARGQKHNKKNLWFELVDGELDHETEFLRTHSASIQLNF